MMRYLRRLLFPFSLLYGLVVIIRNWCYDSGFFKSTKFKFPVISVGNLAVGGAGKSPMTEYLIRKFKDDYRVATLSRGYGRATKGYLVNGEQLGVKSQEARIKSQESRIENQESGIESQEPKSKSQDSRSKSQESVIESQEPGIKSQDNKPENHLSLTTHNSQLTTDPCPSLLTPHPSPLASQIGDEPAQFKRKFPDITVAVCEDRVEGLARLAPDHDLVLMDDAYQHRAVEPGLSILLFDFARIGEPHLLLPAGNMREPFSGRWRAQVLVVSKCPPALTAEHLGALAEMIEPLPYQQLFFTSIGYQPLQDLSGGEVGVTIDDDTTVFLLTGIADATPLVQHLYKKTARIVHHNYPDHHTFTLKNMSKLAAEYRACASQKKMIVTTEKDAQRLDVSMLRAALPGAGQLPVFVAPISVEFLNNDGPRFDQIVTEYVREYTKSHSIH